jgi:hypothetical protein
MHWRVATFLVGQILLAKLLGLFVPLWAMMPVRLFRVVLLDVQLRRARQGTRFIPVRKTGLYGTARMELGRCLESGCLYCRCLVFGLGGSTSLVTYMRSPLCNMLQFQDRVCPCDDVCSCYFDYLVNFHPSPSVIRRKTNGWYECYSNLPLDGSGLLWLHARWPDGEVSAVPRRKFKACFDSFTSSEASDSISGSSPSSSSENSSRSGSPVSDAGQQLLPLADDL